MLKNRIVRVRHLCLHSKGDDDLTGYLCQQLWRDKPYSLSENVTS
jgi:hypothetical protein